MAWERDPKAKPVGDLTGEQVEYMGALALVSWKAARDLSVKRGLREGVKAAVLADVAFAASVLQALGYVWKD